MHEYNWSVKEDNHGNSIYVLLSPYTDESFYFRLKQQLHCDCIIWYSDSDAELGGNMEGETWSNIEDAKRAIEQCYDTCLDTSEHA